MEVLYSVIETLDNMLDSQRRRHLVGGTLLSISVLFGGLALTTMTMKGENIER